MIPRFQLMQKGPQQKLVQHELEKLNINSDDVEYKYFKDEDDGMHFEKKILREKNEKGESIIKVSVEIQDKNHQKLDIDKLNPEKIWQKIDKIEQKLPCLARILCHQIINKPILDNQIKKSDQIRADLKNKVSLNPDSLENVILKVKEQLEDNGVPVILGQKSSFSSQITIKNFVGGFLNDTIKATETIEDKDSTCPYTFNQLLQSSFTFQKFQIWYKEKIAKQIGLNSKNIVIHSVSKGSIKVQWSTNQTSQFNTAIHNQPQLQNRLKLHPFFESYRLSSQDFDPRGNIKFFQSKNNVQYRGGWPYYQPVKCKRYGLKVSKKFDGGDDKWLQMKGTCGQWAVAFHGVSYPNNTTESGKMVLNSIMQGKEADQMLKAGLRQAYQRSEPLNRPNEIVGRGIYFSPHIQIPLQSYTNKSDQYSLVFQCRVNPKQIKVCKNNIYWVVNDSKNIRPYGIILVKKEIRQAYPSVETQFKKKFDYKDYKEKIESYLKSF